jgi:disulfide bond formation protein DsbB
MLSAPARFAEEGAINAAAFQYSLYARPCISCRCKNCVFTGFCVGTGASLSHSSLNLKPVSLASCAALATSSDTKMNIGRESHSFQLAGLQICDIVRRVVPPLPLMTSLNSNRAYAKESGQLASAWVMDHRHPKAHEN